MSRRTARAALLVVLLLGAVLRLVGLRWDAGHHLHPDERFISMVEEKLAFPDPVADYFDSSRSPLNPYNRGDTSFVYGTLPLFATKSLATLIGMKGYDGTYIVGRALSGLMDLFSVWLTYLIVRRVGGSRPAGLFGAGLMSFCVLGIQLSHFWAVDTFLTAFSAAALLGAVRLARGRTGLLGYAATGAAVGLAAACKITGLALFLPVGVGILVALLDPPATRDGRSRGRGLVRSLVGLILMGFAALLALRLALPYAFAGRGLLSFALDPRYVADIKRLAELSRSAASFPPAFQWAHRTILFPVRNFVLSGAGVFFGLSALAAVLWAIPASLRRGRRALAPLWIHAAFLFGYHGHTLVKSVRYFYPAYPALAALAALAFAVLYRRAVATGRLVALTRVAAAVVLCGTFLWAVAFTSIYRRPHPRVAAARWIYANVPPPARFANEAWDDGLPLPLPERDVSAYAGPTLHLFDPDSREKGERIVHTLEESDWIAVTSNRVYGNLTRLPDVFPIAGAYYRALFDGRLGFENVAQFSSYPSLGPLRFPDDRAEEQFTVYDHPRVLLFRKTPAFSAPRARQILMTGVAATPPTLGEWEKWPHHAKRTVPSLLPPRRTALEKEQWSGMPEWTPHSLLAAAAWYGILLAIGLCALPLAHALFPSLQDRGHGIARLLGLCVGTYLLSALVHAGALINGRGAAFLVLLLLAAAGGLLFLLQRRELLAFLRREQRLLLASEGVFLFGFVLFLLIRAFNPEIAWGEKPMDFSILNVLVRTRQLPASDPWFAGAPLGYYTFGHETIAWLSLATGLSTRLTFNLAFGLLGGTILQAAYALCRGWARSAAAGVAGGAFVLLVGNLSGLREWLVAKRTLDWHYFWATSRVVPHTINEYPLWSLLFADLHAHVFAVPLLLLVLACALQLVRSTGGPRFFLSSALLGFTVALQALTNAWDVPLLAGLLLLSFLAGAAASGRPSASTLLTALAGFLIAAAAAAATAAPLWVRHGGMPAIGWNQEPGARAADVLTVFGLFFVLAFGWWLAAGIGRLREAGLPPLRRRAIGALLAAALIGAGFASAEVLCAAGVILFLLAAATLCDRAEDRLACGLLAAGFFLVLFTQRAFIWDRMNTFFKLYYEAWILLAVGTAVLLFATHTAGAFARWSLLARAPVFLLLAAAFFTAVTATRGALDRFSSPSAQERPPPGRTPPRYSPPGGPTLDGLRYLAGLRPGEYRAALWLRSAVRGTPVVLEAQGPSYQEFGRISMLTGLPTVLGWDYHVKQRSNPEEEIEARREAVRSIYSAPRAEKVEAHLRRYHVAYVTVGELERKTYPAAGLRKFATARDLFTVAYENPEVTIYGVAGAEVDDVWMPRREELAEGAVREEPRVEPPDIRETADAGRPAFGGMREPRGAAADARGRLWIADFGNSRLRIFDGSGGFLGGWGGRGAGNHGFKDPCAVAIRGEHLYVADTWNGRVQAYGLSGEWLASATGLYGPRGVAVDARGRVWVSDTGNHRVMLYDQNLAPMQTFGKHGTARGEFDAPVGIAAGAGGLVYVADTGNRRIQVLDAGGQVTAAWPVPGWGGPVEPHVVADGNDAVYVSDPPGNAVFEFDPSGRLRRRLEADADGASFQRPTGIALHEKDRILYVVNSAKNSVSKVPLSKGKKSR